MVIVPCINISTAWLELYLRGSLEKVALERAIRESGVEAEFPVYRRFIMERFKEKQARREERYSRENWPVRRLRLHKKEPDKGITGESGIVVLGAIAINTSNFFVKLVAWAYTGSHSMFSEVSVDTRNQTFIYKIKPTSGHSQFGRYDQPGDPGLRHSQVHLHPDQEPSVRILQRAVSVM